MSESVTTKTKSVTDTDDDDGDEDRLLGDRWSNNISYTQLAISTCIGIVQFWWHPYVHDLRRLLPFLFLYNVFSIVIGYPMFYLEFALGVATKKGVLRCWDLAPVARGVSLAMIGTCVYTAFVLGIVSAYCLAFLVHSWHVFLPWLHCAAASTEPCSARHRPLSPGSDTPAQAFFFNYVLDLKRRGLKEGLGSIQWELTVYFITSWVLVYLIIVKRIYSYSKLVLFKDLLSYFTLLCLMVGTFQLQGASTMFKMADFSVLGEEMKIWREAVEYVLIEMAVAQGTLIMLGSYSPTQENFRLGRTVMFSCLLAKLTSVATAIVLGSVHGVLLQDYNAKSLDMKQGASSSLILYADYVARLPGSQFWSALVFFTLYLLAITSTALLVQTIMSLFTGKSIRKLRWAFLILTCFLFALIGVITLCAQGGLHVVDYAMSWLVSRARLPVAAFMALVVTYVYGQTTFCEDVFFASGEYPSVYLRVCWALIPPFLMIIFLSGMGVWPAAEGVAGWVLVWFLLLPMLLVMAFYLMFKCRVRNIVNEKRT